MEWKHASFFSLLFFNSFTQLTIMVLFVSCFCFSFFFVHLQWNRMRNEWDGSVKWTKRKKKRNRIHQSNRSHYLLFLSCFFVLIFNERRMERKERSVEFVSFCFSSFYSIKLQCKREFNWNKAKWKETNTKQDSYCGFLVSFVLFRLQMNEMKCVKRNKTKQTRTWWRVWSEVQWNEQRHAFTSLHLSFVLIHFTSHFILFPSFPFPLWLLCNVVKRKHERSQRERKRNGGFVLCFLSFSFALLQWYGNEAWIGGKEKETKNVVFSVLFCLVSFAYFTHFICK